jgi:hypothetical protein
MSDSTTLLDTISSGQLQKEVTANALMNSASPAMIFARRASTSNGLTWGYYGGRMLVDGVLTAIINGTVSLTGSTTNYVEANAAGVVSVNTTGFTAGRIPLYTVTASSSSVSSYVDERAWVNPRHITHKASLSITTTDVTLTAAQARCRHIILTGTLTGNRNLIVPNSGEWVVYNNTSGAFSVTVKTSAGTGETVAQGENRGLFADGTNVIAVTTGGGVATSLDDLTDVDTTGAAPGDVLTFDGTDWVPDPGGGGSVSLDSTVTDVFSIASDVISADDPGADRIVFWDDSEGKLTHLTVGSGLSISGTSLTATGGGGAGSLLQIVESKSGAVATGTTTIPSDDTIPQNNEGTEFLTATITPESSTSKLVVDVVLNCALTTADSVIAALFRDSTASAISGAYVSLQAGYLGQIRLRAIANSNSTSATTFKVRAGRGTAGTLTINGYNAGRLLGGVYESSIVIYEIEP